MLGGGERVYRLRIPLVSGLGWGSCAYPTLPIHPSHTHTHRMVETGLLEQEPEPDIRSLPFRTSSTTPHDDAHDAHAPRVIPTPRPIKEKDFVIRQDAILAALPTDSETEKPAFPAFTRLRRPYIDRTDTPPRSQSTPPSTRVTFPPSTTTNVHDARSEFAKAEPLPPARLNDIGPPRPPKRIAELFAPERKLGGDPGWAQSCINTIKCKSFVP